jgi:hypothetical protein
LNRSLLDEAMLAVIAGELSPIVTGLIYCSVIETCQKVYALSRDRDVLASRPGGQRPLWLAAA